jgi:hypothetical protein
MNRDRRVAPARVVAFVGLLCSTVHCANIGVKGGADAYRETMLSVRKR